MAEGLMKYWPVLLVAGSVLISAGGLQWQIRAMADELTDHGDSIDENEEMIEMLRRQLLERQGAVDLRTQRIEIEQQSQTDDLEDIKLLLQQLIAQRQNQ